MDELIYYGLASVLGLLAAIIIVGPRRVLNPRHMGGLYFLVMFITYVLRPTLAFVAGDGTISLEHLLPGVSARILANLQPMTTAFVLSMVAFAIGYRLALRSDGRRAGERETDTPDAHYRKQTARFALLLVAIGYASFFLARRGFVGLAENTTSMLNTGGGSVYTNTTGYVELANYLVISGALLFYAGTNKLWVALFLSLPWAYNQIYFGWSRYMIVALYVGLFGVWLVAPKPAKRISWQSFLLFALAATALSYVILVRGDRFFLQKGSSFQTAAQRSLAQSPDDILGDLAGFEGSWYTLATLSDRTPTYGANIVYQYFIKPIPRLLWPGKPVPIEFTWSHVLGLAQGNDPRLEYNDAIWWSGPVRGSIGYAASEGGWLGIILNFGFTGMVLAWVERRAAVAGGSLIWYGVYGATYALITVLGRIDIFQAGLNQLLLFYLPYLFIHGWLTRAPHISRRRQRQQLRRRIDQYRLLHWQTVPREDLPADSS